MMYFHERLQLSTCTDYEISTCTFSECNTKDDHGGAIFISCTDSKLTIKDCCFFSCSARQGGSLFLTCKSINLERNNFVKSEAQYYSAVYIDSSGKSHVSEIHSIESTKSDTKMDVFSLKAFTSNYVLNSNFSMNSLSKGQSILQTTCPEKKTEVEIQYINFYNNSARLVFYTDFKLVNPISYINFIENTGTDCLLDFTLVIYKMEIEKSSFIRDQSTYLCNNFCSYTQCNFDTSIAKTKFNKSPKFYIEVDCKFSNDKTIDCKIPSLSCFSEQSSSASSGDFTSTPSNDSEKKIVTVSVSVIVSIVLAVAVAIFVLCVIRRRMCQQTDDRIPLMYV